MKVAIIGAGISGLACAIDLARNGCEVMLFERATAAGGKMRIVEVAGRKLDAGPTVFTLRGIFDQLFADAGADFSAEIHLTRAEILARHAWSDGSRLDLFADLTRSEAAIAEFAGSREARGFRAFSSRAAEIHRTLDASFMRAPRPSPLGLARRVGVSNLRALWRIQPFATLWDSLGGYFRDPRLRQLFGRYATYCGSSPFQSPATLMLIAHVEQQGVWTIQGGMHKLAQALANLAVRHGAGICYGAEVARIETTGGRGGGSRGGQVCGITLASGETIAVDAVVCSADAQALSSGLFGSGVAGAVPALPLSARSLSAITWNLVTETTGFPLVRHNVFFSDDYPDEFRRLFAARALPLTPTVYVCAQDRGDDSCDHAARAEGLLCLVNAPAIGDAHSFDAMEIATCQRLTFEHLQRCGLAIRPSAEAMQVTTPADFNRLFPGTGGALYGPASHGWMSSFSRSGSRSSVKHLYLTGGSIHPGPGVPMTAISGRLAAQALLEERASMWRSPRTATCGGTSMR